MPINLCTAVVIQVIKEAATAVIGQRYIILRIIHLLVGYTLLQVIMGVSGTGYK